ncbi:MAG: type IX secretion system membrane protein PorP/SprF [Bacteroidota bacterium]|jgi:type IX secretion system PorP/SprF family membrane protein
MKKINLFASFLILTQVLISQQEGMLSQYMYSGLYINPAFSGTQAFSEVNAIYRKQWVNFDGAPASQILSAEGAVKEKNMGWGAILMNDKIGVSCRTDIHLNYSYHIRTGKDSKLSLGLRGGASYSRANLTDLKVWDGNDQVFASNLNNLWMPNAGVGLFYLAQNFYSGLSCPNVVDYTNRDIFFNSSVTPRFVPHYYLTCGYVIKSVKDIDLKPSFLIKFVPFAPVQADLNLIADYKNKLSLGVSYRTMDGIIALIQIVMKEDWRLGYSYDYPFTKLNQYTYGSHEIMLSFRFNHLKGKNIASF